MNLLLIDQEATVKIAALPPTKSTVPALEFPQLYIIAPGRRSAIKYALETAPPWAFDAWVQRITEGGIIFDYAQAAKLLRIDRSRWNIEEKWGMINALAEAGLKRGFKLPLYSREEAQRA